MSLTQLARIWWRLWISFISFGPKQFKLTIYLHSVSKSQMATTQAITNAWLTLCPRASLIHLFLTKILGYLSQLMMMEIVVWRPTHSLVHHHKPPKEPCGDSCIGIKNIWHSILLAFNRTFILACIKLFTFWVLVKFCTQILKIPKSLFLQEAICIWMGHIYRSK